MQTPGTIVRHGGCLSFAQRFIPAPSFFLFCLVYPRTLVRALLSRKKFAPTHVGGYETGAHPRKS